MSNKPDYKHTMLSPQAKLCVVALNARFIKRLPHASLQIEKVMRKGVYCVIVNITHKNVA